VQVHFLNFIPIFLIVLCIDSLSEFIDHVTFPQLCRKKGWKRLCLIKNAKKIRYFEAIRSSVTFYDGNGKDKK
jgi:hypothetical protein